MTGVDLLHVESAVWVAAAETGVPGYVFRFADLLACRRPWHRPAEVTAVGRLGATGEYAARHAALLAGGVRLVHSPDQHLLASQLPQWYPVLADLTPRSVWFDEPPSAEALLAAFDLPVFLKGERQTSRHHRRLSIIESVAGLRAALAEYRVDPLLRWQRVVCREYLPLRAIAATSPADLPRAYEFRTFWWAGQLGAAGAYWTDVPYKLVASDRGAMLAVAAEAARRVAVTFLVVDVAQAADARWVVIELNDGQDSGYRAIPPLPLWQRVVEIERARVTPD